MTTTLTKAKRKQAQLENHYKALEMLLAACGGNKTKLRIETISNRLRALEAKYNRLATDYCNGDISTDKWGEVSGEGEKEVQYYFNGNLKGLQINGDARGYALKINDETKRTVYQEINLQTDWGGNGLLAPEITGN